MNESLTPEDSGRQQKRPGYLSALAVVLVLWSAGCSLAFAADTLQMIMSPGSDGSLSAAARVLWLHAIWIAIAVGGVAVYRGKEWARSLLSVAFINLILVSAATSSAGNLAAKMAAYFALMCLLFTPGARAYFSRSR